MIIPRLRSPIILIPGLFGFDRLQVCGLTLACYFPGVPELLCAAGNIVRVVQPAPTASVAERAGQLKEFLDREYAAESVHLFAHSMGGLDSRYMISRLGMASRVLTLTTIGTPHRGTVFADWGISRLERFVRPVLSVLGVPHQAFYDLTTTACRTFNEQVPDAAGVRYFSVAGRHEGNWRSPEWLVSHQIVFKGEGPNDGVVSIASATYGESSEVWEGDHLSLINWLGRMSQLRSGGLDHTDGYARLFRRLADEGF